MTHYGEHKANDPYRIVMLFKRKKDDAGLRKSTVCIFQDCAKTSHIIERLPLYEMIAKELEARAYVTINPRDLRKARKLLIHRLVDVEDQDQNETSLIGQTIGSIMRAPKREGKMFMVDVDSKDKDLLTRVHKLVKGEVVETKNGYHIITSPFDVRILEGLQNVEVHKDGMTTLNWLRGIANGK